MPTSADPSVRYGCRSTPAGRRAWLRSAPRRRQLGAVLPESAAPETAGEGRRPPRSPFGDAWRVFSEYRLERRQLTSQPGTLVPAQAVPTLAVGGDCASAVCQGVGVGGAVDAVRRAARWPAPRTARRGAEQPRGGDVGGGERLPCAQDRSSAATVPMRYGTVAWTIVDRLWASRPATRARQRIVAELAQAATCRMPRRARRRRGEFVPPSIVIRLSSKIMLMPETEMAGERGARGSRLPSGSRRRRAPTCGGRPGRHRSGHRSWRSPCRRQGRTLAERAGGDLDAGGAAGPGAPVATSLANARRSLFGLSC